MPALSDTQLLLLSRASQREDGLLTPPETLKGAAARQVASKLIGLGLVCEVITSRDAPHWRNDDEGRAIGLQITSAGLAAIGLELEEDTPAAGDGEDASPAAPEADKAPSTEAVTLPWTPRPGTKQALVLSLLSRPEGASLDDLLAATGWLPHTTRAALTGLRQKGRVLERNKDESGRTVYRVGMAAPPVGEGQ